MHSFIHFDESKVRQIRGLGGAVQDERYGIGYEPLHRIYEHIHYLKGFFFLRNYIVISIFDSFIHEYWFL